jgi:hypothetical protein
MINLGEDGFALLLDAGKSGIFDREPFEHGASYHGRPVTGT